jgi:hypothetical protein
MTTRLPEIATEDVHTFCATHPTARIAVAFRDRYVGKMNWQDRLVSTLPLDGVQVYREVGRERIKWANGARVDLVSLRSDRRWHGMAYDRVVLPSALTERETQTVMPCTLTARWIEARR